MVERFGEGGRIYQSGGVYVRTWRSATRNDGKNPYPPMRPLSYPIRRKPRHVRAVMAVKSRRPSRRAMSVLIEVRI